MLFIPVAILLYVNPVIGKVQIYPTNGIGQLVDEFLDLAASFGEPISPKGIAAFVVSSNPEDACSPIDPSPRNVPNFTKHWAVLIKRGGICNFEDKILNAQNASFNLVIVYNNGTDELIKMHADHPKKVFIPSIFVGHGTGHKIKENYLYDKGYLIRVIDEYPFDLNAMLIPFLTVISLCLITMLGFLIYKCIKDQRRARRRRLPNSSLRKIPTAKYRKGDPYETCAICLDDYVEGEKLRILPCSHAYHSKCIDPWLTRNRRVCPMCKRKVFAAGERALSDTDSASEDDDHTPLLRTAQQTHAGTFTRVFAVAIVNRGRSINNSDDHDDSSSSSSIHSGSVEDNTNRINQSQTGEHTSQPGRSPSRNALIGSREDVNSESNEVII